MRQRSTMCASVAAGPRQRGRLSPTEPNGASSSARPKPCARAKCHWSRRRADLSPRGVIGVACCDPSWYTSPIARCLTVGNRAAERPRLRSRLPVEEHVLDSQAPSEDGAAPKAPSSDSADQLREQAASCRRLAQNARTRAGTKALEGLGDHFDDRASRLDPSSQRR